MVVRYPFNPYVYFKVSNSLYMNQKKIFYSYLEITKEALTGRINHILRVPIQSLNINDEEHKKLVFLLWIKPLYMKSLCIL